MKINVPYAMILMCGVMLALPATGAPLHYPAAPRTNQLDVLHGTPIADPFRPLEDLDAPSTRSWIEAENQVTHDFLRQIPNRDAIRKRLTSLWDYERFGVPVKMGLHYFYSRNSGLQNQSVLYTTTNLTETPRLLMDPNTLSSDGTVALAGSAITDDGSLMAYGLSTAGSDWQTWKVRDVATGKDLPDELKWIKFSSASWTRDNKGFFYSRYDEPKDASQMSGVNRFQKVYYHRLGTPQSEDSLIYHRPDQENWSLGAGVTEDGQYLIIDVRRGTDTKNAVFYKKLDDASAVVVELLKEFDADYTFVGNEGPVFWFRTDQEAPLGRLVGINIHHPERSQWKEIIPQTKETLQNVNYVNRQFIAVYLKDAHTAVKIHAQDGRFLSEVSLPGLGTAGGFGGRSDDTETFYSYTSFNQPSAVYRFDLKTSTSSLFRKPQVSFNPDDYVTTQVFYPSKDGTRVPMFISHKRGLKLNGKNPVYLYGYGGFNISLTPGFSPANLIWMEMGGVYAVANLRGGGEYGEEWHQGGMILHKQNVFDDFIAAAQWLIDHKYTRPSKLAIGGGSNGGLLVGACMTQRPDLFGAALPAVGVMDMLRFHKFTIGWAWTADYGSPDNAEEFQVIRAYSPLHNLKKGTRYPATLITTADHDDRVVPSHSFKFAAALQEAHRGSAPVLIRIETKAGHGAGKPTAKIIEEAADKWAFLSKVLHMK